MLDLDHSYWTVRRFNGERTEVGGTKIDTDLLGRVLAERSRLRFLGLDAPPDPGAPELTRTVSPLRRLLKLIKVA